MRLSPFVYASALSMLLGGTALSEPAPLKVVVTGFTNGQAIPDRYAYCIADENGTSQNGNNINPGITWSGAPEETKSFAVLVVDSEVPEDLSQAYRDDVTIAADAKRRDFLHWVMFNIPATIHSIDEGANSTGISESGKTTGVTAYGTNGSNDYSAFKEVMMGGYDVPCPPFNDEKMHRYHFRVFALDTENLDLPLNTNGAQVLD
ncbi:MAG: YbhB/YbcL family Raf kinase inhibitor-like protein, partial [Alphaproteobacteria bacterium]